MSGKYSAEWWEKFSKIHQQGLPRRDPSNPIEHLIQETAIARSPIAANPETLETHAAVGLRDRRDLAGTLTSEVCGRRSLP